MPNDMSPFPAPLPPSVDVPLTIRFATRTAQYCARAAALTRDPALTMATAAAALDHLADLQRDLASERLSQCRSLKDDLRQVEDQFKPLEADLKQARVDLSGALLRARPGDQDLFGPVPHGTDPDAVVEDDNEAAEPGGIMPDGPVIPTVPAGSVRAVSACRALLDLEALRPHLSAHALRQAIEKHRLETGHCDIRGVSYASLPVSAALLCDVF